MEKEEVSDESSGAEKELKQKRKRKKKKKRGKHNSKRIQTTLPFISKNAAKVSESEDEDLAPIEKKYIRPKRIGPQKTAQGGFSHAINKGFLGMALHFAKPFIKQLTQNNENYAENEENMNNTKLKEDFDQLTIENQNKQQEMQKKQIDVCENEDKLEELIELCFIKYFVFLYSQHSHQIDSAFQNTQSSQSFQYPLNQKQENLLLTVLNNTNKRDVLNYTPMCSLDVSFIFITL